jgi:hypothetical protein
MTIKDLRDAADSDLAGSYNAMLRAARYAQDLGNYPRGFLPLFLADNPTDLLPGHLHR